MKESVKPIIINTSLFICQLPKVTQEQIKKDIEIYVINHDFKLEIDNESNDYIAMQGRFCDIEEIYY